MRLKHPNVVRCFGVTTDPYQIVLDWMENGEIMNYVRDDPSVSRTYLVSPLVFTASEPHHSSIKILDIRRYERSRLPSFAWGGPWGCKTSGYFARPRPRRNNIYHYSSKTSSSMLKVTPVSQILDSRPSSATKPLVGEQTAVRVAIAPFGLRQRP